MHTLPAVYAAGAVRLALPLLVLPLMASRLGADEFGRLSFVLVWASLLSMLVEGGFLAAATRLAVNADAAQRWHLAQQVFTARCVLCVPAALLSVGVVTFVGDGHGWVDALAIAALACALGWPATWYLQATQQLAAWARFELLVYGLLIAACWGWAHSFAVYLLLQLLASAVLALGGWWWLHRDLRAAHTGGLWAREQLSPGLRLGWTMMPVSIAGAAYSYALPAAASLQMTKPELGTYFMADRIVRAVLNAAEPVFAVVYPRIVARFATGARAALSYALRWSLGGLAAGGALALLGAAMWPSLEPMLLRDAASFDLPLLRATMAVLALLLPLLLGWKFIGYWMLGSRRYDVAYRACVVAGGVAGVAGAATVGGAAGPTGLAWVAVGVEVLVMAVAMAGMALTRAAERRTTAG
jgi:O-antigen/teichoic acid export membrane protein